MLVQFSVENFSSFKDEVLLNMIPAKSRTMKSHIISDKEGKSIDVLPVATIYGANASGKTNLVNAIDFMQRLVIKGTKPDAMTGLTPHRLDPEIEKKPSRFEMVFKHNNILYTYGFVISTSIVHEEWLFAYYTSQESKIFERITSDDVTEVNPGNRFVSDVKNADFIKFIAQGTRPNQLFLTEAYSKNVGILKPVFKWFRENLHIISPNSQYSFLALRAHREQNFIEYLSRFLNIVDTGINKITCESEEFDPEKHLAGLPIDIRTRITEDLKLKNFNQLLVQSPQNSITICKGNGNGNEHITHIRLQTEHTRTDGNPVLFNPYEESDGTRRLMDLVPMLVDIWQGDRVFIIDELDRSLHTHISRLFIETIISGATEKNARGQFIMTTHDTNLLDRSLLRRDEIWFIEKDKSGASHLTSLAEYKVSEGLNYENGYLNGRFGAIPFIGNKEELLK